ncbi:pksn polyketide synthase for alternapyrone biosynthesis protein [Colletotrichum incanum]|uniref:Pksn polyketide synthase for alternapyrone biosynthesis protein n=1 Tax=Colletotrichum incanum TaxID=1573173 RepID=A0A162Q4V7_COLIC|nr:pksn polyketide synthase for alternapyrone biosynthesis protein [Colletotrichum incanum]OHW89759.1 PKSN polyketide synthase for alteRNApyrone biosynthesis [Colletotrichum incanum]
MKPRSKPTMEPLAIVGMACCFPGEASTVEKFWEMLTKGQTGHSKVPKDRYDAEAWYHPNHERRGAMQPRSGFFLQESAAAFDAPFFSITAKEAAGMDPMQRKLLEVAYEAFENAGMPMESVAGSQTGVYAGSMTDDYAHISAGDEFDLAQNSASGISRAMLANRVSWFFDLCGPSMTLDTACSSSLYALHLACQSLRLGETTQALVCGANLVLSPNYVTQLSAMHMVGPDGVSHSFDARANGYARGEAVGAVVIKTLRQAMADGDTVRAVVRGTGVNQDGRTAGITVPSGRAQEALIRNTYDLANLPLSETGYFEAHGTGTRAGDPVELGALHATFGAARGRSAPLLVGSVKTNIGHTEGAAGIAGIIKAVLALERAQIPPLAGFDTLNPSLQHLIADGAIVLPRDAQPWPEPAARRASVNSFGFGGANAHAILDDASHFLAAHGLPPFHATVDDKSTVADSGMHPTDDHKLFVFSTHDSSGIPRLATAYANFLRQKPAVTAEDLAYTLGARRSRFNFRSHVVAPSLADLAASLEDPLPSAVRASRHDNVIFIFTGQGAQWPAMGCELLRHDVFFASIARSQTILAELGADWQVVDFLGNPANTKINEPRFCQPVCSILQLALVDLLRHWGITPKATVGHSSGELASAYAAKLVRFEDAVRIAYFRGVYCEEARHRIGSRRGTMLAAALSEAEALEYLKLVPGNSAWIGCINSPSSVTLSGDVESIDHLDTMLKDRGKFARKLRVQLAYHSPHMQSVAEDFLKAIGNIEPCPPSDILMFSSVTGGLVEHPASVDAVFWTTNMLAPVKFSTAVGKLLRHQIDGRRKEPIHWSAAVEIGPHEALKGPFKQIATAWNEKASKDITYTNILSRGKHCIQTAKAAAGILWSLGHPVNLATVNDEDRKVNLKVVAILPPYTWNHDKGFWHEPSAVRAARLRTQPRNDLLGVPIPNQNPMEPMWRNFLCVAESPWQNEHVITGTTLYPAAGMLTMAIEAAFQMASTERSLSGIRFHDVYLDKGLVIPAGDQAVEVFLSVKPHETLDDWFHFTVLSLRPDGSWVKHSWGKFDIMYEDVDSYTAPSAEWAMHQENFHDTMAHATKVDTIAFYDQLQSIGIQYGPLFRNVVSAGSLPGKHKGVAVVTVPDTRSAMPHAYEYPHLIHPATLDAIFHLVYVAMGGGEPIEEAAIPQNIAELFISADLPHGPNGRFTGYSHVASTGARGVVGSIFVSDENWQKPKIIVRDMVMTKVSSSAPGEAQPSIYPKRVAQIVWKEDVDHLTGGSAENLMAARAQKHETPELSRAAAQLSVWLDLLCHKYADLRVLLLQGSTICRDFIGLLTRYAPKNGHGGRFRFCSVISASNESLYQLEDELAGAQVEVRCQVVDTATSPYLGQVHDEVPFDLILTPADITLGRDSLQLGEDLLYVLKQLLAPGGHLAIVGYCGHSSYNVDWRKLVTATGFDCLIAAVDYPDSRLIISSVPAKLDPEEPVSDIVLLERSSPSEPAKLLANQLSKQLTALGIRVSFASILIIGDLRRKAVISLLEVDEPFVISWNAQEFELFQKLVASARYLLWITRGGLLTADERSLRFSPTTGLLRTVRVEKPQISLPHVDLSPEIALASGETVSLIIGAFKSSIQARVNGRANEMEYAASGGFLLIPRVNSEESLDRELELHSPNVKSVAGLLHDGCRRKLTASRSDDIDSLRWMQDEHAMQALSVGEVEVRISHVLLDSFNIKNSLQDGETPMLGREAVGFITRLNSKDQSLEIGQRVFTIVPNAFKTHIRQKGSLIHRIPDVLPSDVAVSLASTVATAWHALHNAGQFAKGDCVLVDAAAQNFGQAVIQLVQMFQGRLLVSVNSKREKKMLMDKYNIPEGNILGISGSFTAKDLAAQTDGRGVDIIIGSSSGVALRHLSTCLAEGGRFVDICRNAMATDIDPAFFKRNTSFSSVNWDTLAQNKVFNLVDTIFQLTQLSRIAEHHSTKTYPVADIGKALSSVQSDKNNCSIVVSLDEDAVVPLMPALPSKLTLSSDFSYILSGGLGALGLSIADSLITHGARHVVFLSRSGASSARQNAALKDFSERGCTVDTIQCDITDKAQVELAAQSCKMSGWKVKGIIQCAMVLQDSIFENMTYERWCATVNPKVKGTWNLHSLFPLDLDFFIVLSSMSGVIGNAGQANYCAGNTYEDSLAHYRRGIGLAGTSLDVGLVTDASHFDKGSTFNSTSEEYLKRYKHWTSAQVTNRELQIVLAAVMRGTSYLNGKPFIPQLLVGITDDIQRGDEPGWPQDRKFDHRVSESPANASPSIDEISTGQKMRSAQTTSEATLAVEGALRTNIAVAITAQPDDIDVGKPLFTFGIDSLKAIEVRNWIFAELQADISVFDVLSQAPISELALMIVSRSSLVSDEVKRSIDSTVVSAG